MGDAAKPAENREQRNQRWLDTIRESGQRLRQIDFAGAIIDAASLVGFSESCDRVEAAYASMMATVRPGQRAKGRNGEGG